MGLSTMIPAVPAIAQANGLLRYPLVFIYWLLLPIVHWGADIPDGTFVADFIIGIERCGTALERCILGGLDMSPCTVSVARARIKRLGVRIFQLDPAPFTALFADLYPYDAYTSGRWRRDAISSPKYRCCRSVSVVRRKRRYL